ncbi:AMP-binding protein [Marinobacter bohaiensis]|uniref:AMP-binding protein n=1 Tax=Marinobacter bohaiensis TaxID=2201898 RepID=UPI000DAB4C69|nr:AMP-binding protein [Marinobacter bohaiensis]
MTMQNSYVSGVSETPLLGMTIGERFDETASRYPDNDALVVHHQDRRYTYRQLQQAVDECARALMTLGVEKGDRVGIWSPNNAEWCITQLATAQIGAILVNINPSYRRHEVEYALRHSGTAVLILQGQFKTSDYVGMVGELVPSLLDRRQDRLASERLPKLRQVVCLDANRTTPGMWHWDEVIALAHQTDDADYRARQASLQFDDPINIQYTSGTTGAPKGATLSHHNILNNGLFVARRMNFTEHDRLVIPVPLYHCFGMVMGNLGCITHGATMIYPSEGFEPTATLEAVQREKATALYGVPTMFIAELEHPEFSGFNLSTLRTGIMAGSNCPAEIMRKVIDQMHMTDVTICYGMTETSPVSLQTEPDAPLDKRVNTVGTVHPHLELKIVDPANGHVVPRGEKGELCTRGYSVMLGYWNNDEATAKSIDAQRWMHTGDLATLDDDGYVAITGRIKDMIIRGGENIYPREIEEFLYTHEAISDAQVIGVPDDRYGEEVMAWVKLIDGQQASEDEIRAFCKANIAHYKVPRYIKLVEDFPMTVTGKIQKFRMREISIDELHLDH